MNTTEKTTVATIAAATMMRAALLNSGILGVDVGVAEVEGAGVAEDAGVGEEVAEVDAVTVNDVETEPV